MRRELEGVTIPGEDEAAERSWAVVRAAFDERLPAPPARRRHVVAVVAAAAVLSVSLLGVAVSPAGPALVRSVRQAVGLRTAAPALVRLPADGRLLVNSGAGPWIVGADGSKRLLGRYTAASWSPHGLFEVATRGHELVALDPKGNVRWSLERPGPVRDAAWSPDGYRIAYLSGNRLRVVAGDGTGDKLLARDVASVPPVWKPGADHVLTFATANGRVQLVNTDTGRTLRHWETASPTRVLWSADGRYLLVQRPSGFVIHPAASQRVVYSAPRGAAPVAWSASGHRLAAVAFDPETDHSSVRIVDIGGRWHQVFGGTGRIDGVAWSPDGGWLVLAWQTADQWLFARTTKPTRLRAVASISAQFHSATFPRLAGWCC